MSAIDDDTARAIRGRERSALDELEALVARRLQYIRLTQQCAEIANSAESVADAVYGALRCFCRELDWCVGHAYLPSEHDPERYEDSGIWWIRHGFDAARFVRATAATSFEPGEGFVGSVIESMEARWLGGEIADALSFRRPKAARAVGLECGIAFPILVQSRVAGVLEFYVNRPRMCEPELLDAAAEVGTQLGRAVEREEFERNLARISQEERRRLGRELHDTLSQELTGIGMLARSLERKLEDEGHAEVPRARVLVESIQESRRQLRAIARGLNPVDVDAGNLMTVVEEFAADTAQAFGVPCSLEGKAVLQAQDDFTANQLFCIVREAVHNAVKHGEAGTVSIEVSEHDGRSLITVRDDGCGFDVDEADKAGMGLRTLRYRARLIGAWIRVESKTGEGTAVTCTLPRGE